MIDFKVGDQVIFGGYAYPPPDGYEVFRVGERAVVHEVEPDGVLRCFPLIDERPLLARGDTLFAEEVLPLRHAGQFPIRAFLEGSR